MKKIPFFAIILVVLSLGCSASDSPVGPGLMVKEFKFTPNYLNGDQKTALTLVVQNKGSKNIEGAYAEVYGFGEESEMWQITGGEAQTTTSRFSLRAPSSFTNNVGEEKRLVWLMNNNDLIPKDAVRPYTANARVCYPYETSVLARAEIISENEWMSNPPSQHQIDVKQTTGPVRVTILSKQPVIMSSKVSLELLVENVGSGTVARKGYCDSVYGTTSSAGEADLNYIDIDIKGISDNCEIEDGDELFLEQGRRQKITVSCEVSGIDAPITTADISITLNYDYYLDAKASVRVKGPVNVDGKEEPTVTPPTTPTGPTLVQLTGTEGFGVSGISNSQACSSDTVAVVGDLTTGTNYNFRLTNQGDTVTISQVDVDGNPIGQPVNWHVNEGVWLVKNDAQGVAVNYVKTTTGCTTRVCNGPLADCKI